MADSLEKRVGQEPSGWFSEKQLAEIGIKVALNTTIDFIEKASFFVIPKGEEFREETVSSVLEKYGKGELNYRLVTYNEPVPTKMAKPVRQAIVFDKEGITIEEKRTVYDAIKNGRQLTVSQLATSAIVDAQVWESIERVKDGPPPTIASSAEDIGRRVLETVSDYHVTEIKPPIKQGYVSAINRLLAGAGQLAYKIDAENPNKIIFFDGAYMGRDGEEKRALAIKGLLDMQLTLEMRIKGESLGSYDASEIDVRELQ